MKNIFHYRPVSAIIKCSLIIMLNRFTSAIRSVFTYRGTEHLMSAGGEELWVFVNGIMVIGILHDPSVSSIPCKSVTLRSGKNIFRPEINVCIFFFAFNYITKPWQKFKIIEAGVDPEVKYNNTRGSYLILHTEAP